MKKMFKKLTALTLTMAMLLSISINSLAVSKEQASNIEIIEKTANTEIVKIDDSIYSFEITENEVISSEIRSDGSVDQYVNRINEGVLEHYVSNDGVLFNLIDVEQLEKNEVPENNNTRSGSLTEYYEVKMEQKYGEPYAGKTRAMYTQSGKTCKIQETQRYEVRFYDNVYVNATLSLVAASAKLLIPVAGVMAVVTYKTVNNVKQVAKAIDVDVYSCEVLTTQLAQIDNATQAAAGRNIQCYAAHSTVGVSDVYEANTNIDTYFDNFSGLSAVAFDVYFN